MKCHSDFIVGKRYDCPNARYKGALCVGHMSGGGAIVEKSDGTLHVVARPEMWRPAKQKYIRYTAMYPDGPGIFLYTDKEAIFKDEAENQGIIGAAKVTIEWDENSDE